LTKGIGVNISSDQVIDYLTRMQLDGHIEGNNVIVSIPPLRSDIMHACDILEDVAIGYGFNKVLEAAVPPSTLSHAFQQPLNKYTDQLRNELAQAGFTEVMTFSLLSNKDNFTNLNKPIDNCAVIIANSIQSFQVVRTTLFPGLLKTVKASRKTPLPINIFEVSDIVLKSNSNDVGATNHRYLCAFHVAKNAEFEIIHGLLDRVMLVNDIPHQSMIETWRQTKPREYTKYYFVREHSDATYLPGRCAEVVVRNTSTNVDTVLGTLGIVHPDVLKSYKIPNPISALHINIEYFAY